jgi:hypothetical protein
MGELLQCNVRTRRAYATLLRRFMAGRMTTDDYEEAYCNLQKHGRDEACEGMFWAAWHTYDDIVPHRMTGSHALSADDRRIVARWLLFLRGQLPYTPPALVRSPPQRRRDWAKRALGVLMVLIGLGLLAASPMITWAAGLAFGILAILIGLAMASRPDGMDAVVSHAFEPTDPWPFASDDDLRTACAAPTYLYGRKAQ